MNLCQHLHDVHLHHDGQLDPTRRSALEAHLAACDACRQELAELGSLGDLMRSGPLPAITPLALARLHQRVDQRMNIKAERGVIRLAQWLTGVAAAVLLVSSAQLALLSHRATQADTAPTLAWRMTTAMLQHNATTEGVVTDEHSLAAWMVSDLSTSAGTARPQE